MKDAYKSLIEALSHGGIANKVKVNLDWIESEVFENEDPAPVPRKRQRHPGARPVSASAGAEGKIRARSSPASATSRISASASACRWRSSKPHAYLVGIEEANSPSSAQPKPLVA